MPSNKITINGQENLSWEVPDSRMEAVIAMLNGVGTRQDPDEDECEECDGTGLNALARLEKGTSTGTTAEGFAKMREDHPCKFCEGTGKQR